MATVSPSTPILSDDEVDIEFPDSNLLSTVLTVGRLVEGGLHEMMLPICLLLMMELVVGSFVEQL